jgi:Tfp pilus assembly protein PilE
MGQQQLLLIILGVIVVGIAVAVGITMFQDNAISANRDAVTNDLVNLAARAQQYYRRPTALGGGQGSFAACALDQLTSKPSNANGVYVLSSPTAASVTLTGTGVENGNDGTTPVEVVMIVYADSMTTTVNN